jgi:GrpB-like predicted nucleotidyltransferase (UPF0157 family)
MPSEESARIIEVVPYDEAWVAMFEDEEAIVRKALGRGVLEVHHIGSTAIPGMWAKPVLDILVVVRQIDEVDGRGRSMAAAGYGAKGEFGIPGRRFFTKGGDKRTHHAHVFQKGSPDIRRHLDFRDFMIAHQVQAAAYAELKRSLAARFRDDIDAYCDGKDPFIKAIDAEASAWAKVRRR